MVADAKNPKNRKKTAVKRNPENFPATRKNAPMEKRYFA